MYSGALMPRSESPLAEHLTGGRKEGKAGISFGTILNHDALGVVERVEGCGEFLKVVAKHVRSMSLAACVSSDGYSAILAIKSMACSLTRLERSVLRSSSAAGIS